MKKIITIVLIALATAAFGSQATQVAEARAQHIREVQRARAERVRRLEEREMRAENARIIVEESKKSCPIVIVPGGRIYRTIHPSQCGLGIGEGGGSSSAKKSKKPPRNTLGRGVSSGPARRRKK